MYNIFTFYVFELFGVAALGPWGPAPALFSKTYPSVLSMRRMNAGVFLKFRTHIIKKIENNIGYFFDGREDQHSYS